LRPHLPHLHAQVFTFLPTAEAGPLGEVQRWAMPPGCVRLFIDACGAAASGTRY
jgi:hypothetical protein